MANNRLYLKCKRTGETVQLANYDPEYGWYVRNKDLIKDLNEMFRRDNNGGMFDPIAHELEYEKDVEAIPGKEMLAVLDHYLGVSLPTKETNPL